MSDTSDTTSAPATPPAAPRPRLLTEPKYVMAIVVLALSFAILAFYVLGIAKDGDVKLAVVGFITLILGYYFGSSTGSADKTSTLTDLVKKP